MIADGRHLPGGLASPTPDAAANREVWIETVKSANAAGLGDTIPRRKARTKGEIDLRDRMAVAISRKTYSVPALPWKTQGGNAA